MSTRVAKLRTSLLFAAALALPTQSALADMVSTDRVASDAAIQADREKIRAFMSRADAERSLKALGVDAASAKARVDALTDAEVIRLADKIDTLPAGGDLGKNDIVIILLIAILVALIL